MGENDYVKLPRAEILRLRQERKADTEGRKLKKQKAKEKRAIEVQSQVQKKPSHIPHAKLVEDKVPKKRKAKKKSVDKTPSDDVIVEPGVGSKFSFDDEVTVESVVKVHAESDEESEEEVEVDFSQLSKEEKREVIKEERQKKQEEAEQQREQEIKALNSLPDWSVI